MNPCSPVPFHGRTACTLLLVAVLAVAVTACSSEPPAPTPPSETAAPKTSPGNALVVGKAPRDAVVTLEPTDAREFPPPAEAKVLDQFGMTFIPDVLLVQVGQRVDFRSSEDVLHNVRVDESATKTPVFNIATPPFGTYTHVFDRPGYYDVSCDVHAAMRASILVTTTPYAVLAGDDGTFTFADVPSGSYKLTVALRGQQVERIVEVAAPKTELSVESFES